MTRTPTTWARTLADQFAHGFSSEAPGTRTIGREAEFPIVNESGWAGSVQNVLRAAAQQNPEFKTKSEGSLLVEVEGPQFSLAAEVGIGTVELITGPCSDLSSLESQHLSGLECLLRATEATQTRVLGLGIQPRSLATPTLMCEKARYGVLHERMGQDWLWFTLTASDQVHVDIGLDELAAVTNTTSLLTAATVGLCGNSSIYHDRSSGVCSAREHLMGKIFSGDHRHGMPAGPIEDLPQLMDQLMAHQHLMMRRNGVPQEAHGSFLQHLARSGHAEGSETYSDFLFHEHYVWNSSRPRSAQGTIELRSACQQPAEDHMVATALGLAMVEGHQDLADLLRARLGTDPWPAARAWHEAVILHGLAAEEPTAGLTQEVLHTCAAALTRRQRGEERYLEPLFRRLGRAQNPAQFATARLEMEGMDSLIRAATIDRAERQR